MKEIIGNIWTEKADAKCITTNGIVKNNGALVMGAGIALDAKIKFPEIDFILGDKVKTLGNQVHIIKYNEQFLISFPTKHHFKDKSDIDLIIKSCKELMTITEIYSFNKILLPRPGCMNGGLDWDIDVKPVIKDILSDKIILITKTK